MMSSIVAEILSAAARAEREYDPGFSMITLARDVVELGEPELGLQIANDANPEPGGAWFAYLATLHAMVGRADDVERLGSKALEDPSNWGYGKLAEAYARLGDLERADRYAALVDEESRSGTLGALADLAVDGGDLARAVKLAERPEVRDDARWWLAALRLRIARGYVAASDDTSARAWLERAAELAKDPKAYSPNLDVAIATAELGDVPRALELIRAVDRATYEPGHPYTNPESLSLARAYAAVGETKKVDEILYAYAAFYGQNTATGFAGAAHAYLSFGRELHVRKFLKQAEAALEKPDDSGHASLVTAYIADRQFVTALKHAEAIVDPDLRAQRLVDIARGVRSLSIEPTTELLDAVARLP